MKLEDYINDLLSRAAQLEAIASAHKTPMHKRMAERNLSTAAELESLLHKGDRSAARNLAFRLGHYYD